MKESDLTGSDSSAASKENQKTKASHLIYCFICGIAYKSTGFTSHYLDCKKSFVLTPLGKERPIIEEQCFVELIFRLQQGEDFEKELEEYNLISEGLYFNLLAKECPKCRKRFMPDVYLKHAENCKRSRFNTDLDAFPNLDPKVRNKQERNQRRRRKTSMDNLKSLTKDEMKGFRLFNLKLVKDNFQ